MSDLARRMRAARKATGLNQQTVAERTGVRLSTISSIECGRSQPRTDLLDRIARVLGVSIDSLVRGDQSTDDTSPSAEA